MNLEICIQFFCFIFGALIGSFLNVVIYRMPKGESVVTPRSSCPQCKNLIKWYENIPILSYVVLRGKCSNCLTKISIRYPLIELIVGIIAVYLSPQSLEISEFISFLVFFSIAATFLAHFIIDVEHQLLPDKLNLYLLLVITPYVVVNFPIHHWLIGGAIGF